MLDIAICDDDPVQLALLSSYTYECLEKNHLYATVLEFSHPDELLRVCESKRFHLYILDIVMPMLNGIEVGKAIRERDQEALILFATYEPSFALQSFAANPINYLIKPIDKQQFFKTLALAVTKLKETEVTIHLVKTHDGIRVLKLSEILFCEYSKHAVTYSLCGERTVTTKVIRGTFGSHIEPLLQDKRFIRPHVSFVLNMDWVDGFDKNWFRLRSGAKVPIVAKQYSTVRDTYLDYIFAKGLNQ
ncbi:LytR/AlgR family response regulator transcription factor [Sphaerochaeta sp.]|uniref:LytR/AlgR family response regulator transcription factor n=1 Tax=Sphaerochaeta sp. TaxID=1972642 RepID=UPI002FCA8C40